MYRSIEDLPIVCRINLPEAALHVYRDAFNRAWRQANEEKTRHHVAQTRAWTEVREKFERDRLSGRWVPKATPLEARVAQPATTAQSDAR